MTGGVGPDPGDGLVPGDLDALHRTAVLLTMDADLALDLVAPLLLRRRPLHGTAADPPDSLDRLRAELVRAYLHMAPRQPDGPGRESVAEAARHEPGADAYDVLRALRPRARAVTVLRVAHGWELAATATTVGLTPRRAEALLPDVPGLDRALEAVGEQHHLSTAEVLAAVGHLAAPAANAQHPPRRWSAQLLVGTGAVVALAAWSVLTHPDAGADTPPDAVEDTHADPGPDLTPYGWRLDEDQKPPVVAMGLQRQTVVDLSYTDPSQEVTWDAGHLLPGGPAAYAVLWCDLPPDDPHIEQPSARLATGAMSVDLPCAGRDGGPPVHQVTAVPVSGPAQVELVGDLPRTGGATLAFYREGALSATLPLPEGSTATTTPPVPTGAAVVEEVLVPRDWAGRTRLVGSLRVSAASELQVWAGRTGSVSVFVDGLPVTDDGDLANPDDPGWQGQQVDLRDGRWVVYLPGTSRTFPLPEQLRPPDGRARVVTVEVFTQGMGQDLQVLATRAQPARPRPTGGSAVPLDLPGPDEFLPQAGGHRLVGAWTVPQDGLAHDLRQVGRPDLEPGTELVAFTGAAPVAGGPDRDEGWGLAQHREDGGDVVRPLLLAPGDPDADGWSARRLDPWRVQQDLTVPVVGPGQGDPTVPVAGPGHAPRVWLPAVPGHPPATVLALAPVWDNGAQ
ncbi:hypothetical protein [Ornithinimicrobium pratense]|uniref:Uncharacterized protein n=1 Tax=Ornithinimicrobium pratense TaxID=2593973 RepID=A0A5J6V3S4_9MICO|nr:hypothetical protein [Ornithinimicrobium pratense]QFG67936.1 hypothetical protein FY030_03670 [Ornithinimicrobium pratense]